MPPVQIPESGNAYLQFKQWYDFSPDGIMGSTDFGAVLVSTDRVNWEMFARTEATGIDEYTTDEWIDAEVDLSAYAGNKIYICFYMNAFATDYELRLHDGWYVDDIALTDQPLEGVEQYMQQGTEGLNHTKQQSEDSILAPNATHVEDDTNHPNVLPIGGKVTVLDSGFSSTTDPANGSFSMKYKAGEFTLRAEAYGFHSKDQRVSVPKDGIVESDFSLEPLGKGTVKGVIKDEKTGKPLVDAIISIVEDAAITPVKTDSKGRFALTAYEGTYTLHVFKRDYVFSEQTVTLDSGKKTTQNIELKRFIGVNGEIGYDDGTSEDSWFFGFANNGFAIKMSLDKGVTKSWLTGGLFKVNTEAPYRGTRFQVAVYDSTGVNGDPGKLIAGPFDADARTDGEWTHVDLMDKNIFVTGDFYLVYIQPDGYLDRISPSLYSDTSSTFHDRNWFFLNGVWEQNTNPIYGNMMIRAVVNNSLPVPVIESPLNDSFTKESKVIVKGQATPSSTVIIQNNGKDKAKGKSKEDGSFAISVDLKKGENRLTAVTETKDGRTDPSEAVNIILDQKKPVDIR
ncbi:carboxypeptidase regulatory-like domain-containing protein [Bacillus haimaensis]|uniref:carboxypeptidase regulatory-like domain-containing protein n=1 Tax=Bacillus haimaensis TaxID=3160967 RepID=UPI003AA82519